MQGAVELSSTGVRIRASSVSRPLRDGILKRPTSGHVLSVFRRACIVQFDGESLVALVRRELGDGPLNVVIERAPGEWLGAHPGIPARLQGSRLQLGQLDVSLDTAESWEPCPDWGRLRTRSQALLARMKLLSDQLEDLIPGDTMLGLVQGSWQFNPSMWGAVHTRALEAAEAMWAGWRGNEAQLRAGAAGFAGLGSGLTPAGDDFLVGTMLCAWLMHPSPSRYCEPVLEACLPRTTLLSRALLQAAAGGECSAPWHRLLEALEGGSDDQLDAARRDVLSYGHTSGADALAGFLWMGLRTLESQTAP